MLLVVFGVKREGLLSLECVDRFMCPDMYRSDSSNCFSFDFGTRCTGPVVIRSK